MCDVKRDSLLAPENQVLALIKANTRLMQQLHTVATLSQQGPEWDISLPNWAIGGGSIRNCVWNAISGLRVPPNDVDVVYFETQNTTRSRDKVIEATLLARDPDTNWAVMNQSRAHEWIKRVNGVETAPFSSLDEAVATWVETATSVAITLDPENQLCLIAPYGVGDLLNGVLRRAPVFPGPDSIYEKRCQRFLRAWPFLQEAS